VGIIQPLTEPDQPLRASGKKKPESEQWLAHAFSVNSKIDLWRDAPRETQGAEPLGCVANPGAASPIVRESWEWRYETRSSDQCRADEQLLGLCSPDDVNSDLLIVDSLARPVGFFVL